MSKRKMIGVATAAIVGIGALSVGALSWARGEHEFGDRLVNRTTQILSLDEGQVASLRILQNELNETRALMRGAHEGSLVLQHRTDGGLGLMVSVQLPMSMASLRV